MLLPVSNMARLICHHTRLVLTFETTTQPGRAQNLRRYGCVRGRTTIPGVHPARVPNLPDARVRRYDPEPAARTDGGLLLLDRPELEV